MIVAIFPAFLYLSGKRESRRYLFLSYAGAALAFLAKGLIGIVFPAAILLLWMMLSRRHREIGKAISLPGLALFLAIALPWVILVQRANPDFLWFFFVREHFLRFTTKIHHRYEPFWFFLPIVIGGSCSRGSRSRAGPFGPRGMRGRSYLPAEDRRFLFCWVLFVFLFFSFSNSKLVTYVTPLFPPLAVLFGRALDLWVDREDGSVRCRTPLALAAILAAGIVLFPPFTRHAIEPSRWVPLCALPAALILAWGAMPLFIRRLSAERVVYLSFLLLALFLTSLNRPAAEYLGKLQVREKALLRPLRLPARGRRRGAVPDVSPGASLLHEAALRPRERGGGARVRGGQGGGPEDVLSRRRGVPRPVEFAGPRLLRGPQRQSSGVSGRSSPATGCSTGPMRVSSS